MIKHKISNSSDGRVVRASASGAVGLDLIPSRVKPMTSYLVCFPIHSFLILNAQHLRDSVENKPSSLLVVPLGRALRGIPSSWCGRQMAGNS